jgi:hypothetical protein
LAPLIDELRRDVMASDALQRIDIIRHRQRTKARERE